MSTGDDIQPRRRPRTPCAAKSRSSSGRIATPLASSAWPAPEIRRGSSVRVVSVLLLAFSLCPDLFADEVHLAGGRVVRAGDCRKAGQELTCRIGAGTVGFPLDQVLELVKEKDATPPSGRTPRPPRDPIAAEVPVLEESRALTPDAARSRIDQLGAGPGRPGDEEAPRRAELAYLHAFLGNTATQSGDFAAAKEEYEQALRHDPSMRVARLNLATVLINMDRHLEADEQIRDVLAGDPDDPRALYLRGESSFQTGRLREAIESWEASLAIEPSALVRRRLEQARRFDLAESGFLRSEGAHFSLKFDGEAASQALVDEILDYLESSHADLSSRFYHVPRGVIQVTLYSRRSFHEATDSPDWVGGLYDGQIRVPVGGLSALTPRARRVLIHELAHCFVASKSHGNVPRWLQEGIAQVVEGKRSSSRDLTGLRQAYEALGAPSFGAEFSYPKSLSQLEFFLDTWSESHLNDLLDHLARGTDIDGAMVSVTGTPYGGFLRAWAEWLGE